MNIIYYCVCIDHSSKSNYFYWRRLLYLLSSIPSTSIYWFTYGRAHTNTSARTHTRTQPTHTHKIQFHSRISHLTPCTLTLLSCTTCLLCIFYNLYVMMSPLKVILSCPQVLVTGCFILIRYYYYWYCWCFDCLFFLFLFLLFFLPLSPVHILFFDNYHHIAVDNRVFVTVLFFLC